MAFPSWFQRKRVVDSQVPPNALAIADSKDDPSNLSFIVPSNTSAVGAPPLKPQKRQFPKEIIQFYTVLNDPSEPAPERIAKIQRWLERPIKKQPNPDMEIIGKVKDFVRNELNASSEQPPEQRLSRLRVSFGPKSEEWGYSVITIFHSPDPEDGSLKITTATPVEYVSHTGLFGELEGILSSLTSYKHKAKQMNAIMREMEDAFDKSLPNPWLEKAKDNPLLHRLTEETLATLGEVPTDEPLESQIKKLCSGLDELTHFADTVQSYGEKGHVIDVKWILRTEVERLNEARAEKDPSIA